MRISGGKNAQLILLLIFLILSIWIFSTGVLRTRREAKPAKGNTRLEPTAVPAAEQQDPASTAGRLSTPTPISPTRTPAAPLPASQPFIPRVYLPQFDGPIVTRKTAVFWFGRIDPDNNYADVRLGYNQEELYVHVAVVDRRLWYKPSPSPNDLEAWDAASLYLELNTPSEATPGPRLRFTGMLSWWEDRTSYQSAERWNGSVWEAAPLEFETESAWRGNEPNNDRATDRGWSLTYRIPFRSLGLDGPPPPGATWALGMVIHDRDDLHGGANDRQRWPPRMDTLQPETWGRMTYGMPVYTPPRTAVEERTVIRNGADGETVQDAAVGGDTICGTGLEFWTEWGQKRYAGSEHLNVQNQYDIADWPCFSKVYLTFPLDRIPTGKAILSARLVLYQFGNSGGGEWGPAPDSVIQVFRASSGWQEDTINWNNAPLALENGPGLLVSGLAKFPGWPGVPRSWDVSRLVAGALASGEPLRLILYSADTDYHTGKYFSSSDVPAWNAQARPALEVEWGSPSREIPTSP